MGCEVWSEATAACIRRAWDVTGCRIVVTESGIGTADSAQRIDYIDKNLAGLAKAKADGIPVDGYLHWTLLDNFEWTNGYGPKFGLVNVDRETFKRTPKPSLRHLGMKAASLRF
jgi:beta-glucosidase